jgi:hypothetical protein
MKNKEICKIFNEAMSLLMEKTRRKGMTLYAGHPDSHKHSLRVMKELTTQATIERLLGYEKNDEGKIVKRVRSKAQQQEATLLKRAADGDIKAADELLKLFSKELK